MTSPSTLRRIGPTVKRKCAVPQRHYRNWTEGHRRTLECIGFPVLSERPKFVATEMTFSSMTNVPAYRFTTLLRTANFHQSLWRAKAHSIMRILPCLACSCGIHSWLITRAGLAKAHPAPSPCSWLRSAVGTFGPSDLLPRDARTLPGSPLLPAAKSDLTVCLPNEGNGGRPLPLAFRRREVR